MPSRTLWARRAWKARSSEALAMTGKKQALGKEGIPAFPGNNHSAAKAIARQSNLDGELQKGEQKQSPPVLSEKEFALEWLRAKSNYNYPTLNDAKAKKPEGGYGGCFDFSKAIGIWI